MTWAILILAAVTIQRLAELVLAQRNTARLMARGGVERAGEHYYWLVVLHAGWLAGLWYLAWDAPINPYWLVVFVGLQALRVWVLATLGDRWTTRIIVVPGEPRVKNGPYRLMNHPNYAIVIGEIAVLPLVFGLPLYAVLFSILNGVILFVRINAETTALESVDSMISRAEP